MESEGLRLFDTPEENFDDVGRILEQGFCRSDHAWSPLAVTRLPQNIQQKGDDMIKINFGSGGGEGKLSGWTNVDLDRNCRPDVIADLSKDLPFSTASVDYIHSEDFIVQLSLG